MISVTHMFDKLFLLGFCRINFTKVSLRIKSFVNAPFRLLFRLSHKGFPSWRRLFRSSTLPSYLLIKTAGKPRRHSFTPLACMPFFFFFFATHPNFTQRPVLLKYYSKTREEMDVVSQASLGLFLPMFSKS